MTSISRINSNAAPASAKKTKQAAGAFKPSGPTDAKASAGASEPTPASTLSALIALQSEDFTHCGGSNGKTFAAAQQILGELDRLQHTLLGGAPDGAALEALEAAAALRAHAGADAELLDIYDQITLRARVELAKLGR